MVQSRGDTRARILRTAAELFQRQGYGATGLNQVLTASGAPKGSLYFHFPQGEERFWRPRRWPSPSTGARGGRMAAAVSAATGWARRDRRPRCAAGAGAGGLADYRDGCPIATVALEEAGDAGPIHDACQETYRLWLSGLTGQLRGWGSSRDRGPGAGGPCDVRAARGAAAGPGAPGHVRHPYGRPAYRGDRHPGSELTT